jgi:hypothetical protein
MRYRVLASYQGAQYEAGIGPDDLGVVLFAACPPPEELHFEPATGHWRKRVGRADVQMLYESRPMGTFRGERCVVLDDLGDRLHIVYLGHDAFRAEQLGYWEVDRGVFELITPRQEVTEIVELRLPLPLPGDGGPHSGPIPAINPANGYGPGPTTGPIFPTTGPIPAVRNTGPIPAVRHTGPIPAVRHTGPIPAVRPNAAAGPSAPGGPKAAPGRPNPAGAANVGSRPISGPGSKLPASRSGVSMPPPDVAPLPLEAEAMRAATRRGKKAQAPQAQPQRASQQSQQPQSRQQGPAQPPAVQPPAVQPQPGQPQPGQPQPARTQAARASQPASAQVGATATATATAAAQAQAPAAGPIQAPDARPTAGPIQTATAGPVQGSAGPIQPTAPAGAGPAGQSVPAAARIQAAELSHPSAQALVSQSGQEPSAGPQPPHAAGLSEPANVHYLDPDAASGVPSWTPQAPPQHAPAEPAVAAPVAAVLAEPAAASVTAPPAAVPAQQPAPALPDAGQPATSQAPPAPPAQPVAAQAPHAEAAQPQPAGPQPPPVAPVVGRRRRSTKRRLPTQRIFSDLATQAAIPASAYAIGEDVDGAMCLMRTDEGFEVFNSAGGARHEVRDFDDEESAYFYLFGVLVADAVRTGALVPRQ